MIAGLTCVRTLLWWAFWVKLLWQMWQEITLRHEATQSESFKTCCVIAGLTGVRALVDVEVGLLGVK